MRDPVEVLAEGSAVLAPTLEPLGYVLVETTHGNGSGGPMAVGRWVSGDRFIETHVRGALGIVEYGWGSMKIKHQDYLRVRGLKGTYPGFGDDPIDGFRHLVADLAGPLKPLLLCDRGEFEALIEAVNRLPSHVLP